MDVSKGPLKAVGFRAGLPALLLLVLVFISNMLSRSILSPLLLRVERDFGVSHGPAARLFLYIGVGYSILMLLSGFVSSRVTHRGAILLSSLLIALALGLAAAAGSMEQMGWSFLLLGAGSGLYPPSGIATVTALIDRGDWQKALSIHELGPHAAMVLAPLYANFLSAYTGWRGTLAVLAGIVLLIGVVYFLRIKAGTFKGEAPTREALRPLLTDRNFWILMIFFGFSLGGIQGIYLLVPTFLVTEGGFSLELANNIFGVSRFLPILALLTAGLLMDRLGLRRALFITLSGAGLMVFLMGFLKGPLLIVVVFLQPAIGALFFPAGIAALSEIGSPHSRNVAVSMVLPGAALFGTGLIPAFLGYMGDEVSFSFGMMLLGAAMVGISLLVMALTIREESSSSSPI